MQVIDSEIVITFKYKSRLRNSLILSCVVCVFSVGGIFYLLVSAAQMATRESRFPDFQNEAHQEVVFGTIFLVLMLLVYGLFFVDTIRKLRGPSAQLRISHEGIFMLFDAFLMRWEEIKEVSPSIFLGYPLLRIVPCDAESVVARASASARGFRSLLLKLNWLITRDSKTLSPLNISQRALPISIDELISAIQEHFAIELRAYHITVRGWQN
ncbi:MAG: hypothetical protein M3Y81_20580 [Chloroflexota bacterium]|nr:hypothetical protein [Chloroflexota bacterium]